MLCIGMCVYVYRCMYMCMYKYVCVCICICVYTCVYVYIYLYILDCCVCMSGYIIGYCMYITMQYMYIRKGWYAVYALGIYYSDCM